MMPEWITLAAVVVLIIAVLKASHSLAYWRGEVESDRKSLKKSSVRAVLRIVLRGELLKPTVDS